MIRSMLPRLPPLAWMQAAHICGAGGAFSQPQAGFPFIPCIPGIMFLSSESNDASPGLSLFPVAPGRWGAAIKV
jgi:hypothetical protein